MKKLIAILVAIVIFGKINAQSITISEVNYKSDSTNVADDWFEIHNFGTTAVDISGWTVNDSAGVNPIIFNPGTIIQPNEYRVCARNLSRMVQIYSSSIVANVVTTFTFKINSFDSLIMKNDNGDVIVRAVVNSTRIWPDGADGEGRTMQLINESSNTGLDTSISWRDGCMLGSPGAPPQTNCNDKIIITEINYASDSLKDQGEFIELYNNSTSDFNLNGYYMRDGSDSVSNRFSFPQGLVLQSGKYLVISNDTSKLFAYHGKLNNVLGNFTYGLKNSGELMRLYNPNNVLVYSMHYRDTLTWTDSARNTGRTLEIKNYAGRTNDGRNYFAGCIGGSPGGPYTPNCKPFYPISIQEASLENVLIYPIIANDQLNIEQYSQPFTLKIYDEIGKLIIQQKSTNSFTRIDLSNLNRGVYFVTLLSKNGQKLSKKIIKL
jgi:hypothetical protein